MGGFEKYSRPDSIIYHGDCLRALQDIADASVDLVFADPPYNIGKKFGARLEGSLMNEYGCEKCGSSEAWEAVASISIEAYLIAGAPPGSGIMESIGMGRQSLKYDWRKDRKPGAHWSTGFHVGIHDSSMPDRSFRRSRSRAAEFKHWVTHFP
jgi:hypothetical protein